LPFPFRLRFFSSLLALGLAFIKHWQEPAPGVFAAGFYCGGDRWLLLIPKRLHGIVAATSNTPELIHLAV